MKFGTAHGRSRPEVGSAKCIDVYGKKGVPPAPRIFGNSDITLTGFWGSKHNFFSLRVEELVLAQ